MDIVKRLESIKGILSSRGAAARCGDVTEAQNTIISLRKKLNGVEEFDATLDDLKTPEGSDDGEQIDELES